MKSTLLLNTEQVERCDECGKPSTCSIGGREHWRVERRKAGRQRLVEICTDCQNERARRVPPPRPKP